MAWRSLYAAELPANLNQDAGRPVGLPDRLNT
jgi:hypothetical protein